MVFLCTNEYGCVFLSPRERERAEKGRGGGGGRERKRNELEEKEALGPHQIKSCFFFIVIYLFIDLFPEARVLFLWPGPNYACTFRL